MIEIIKKIVPLKIYRFCAKIYRFFANGCNALLINYRLKRVCHKQKHALSMLKSKEVIRCVFFAIYDSNWKFDSLYRLMVKNSRFEPIIVVCPVVNYGEKHMLQTMEQCYNTFIEKGYNVVKAYNESNGSYLDVKKELSPDVIFFTNPYKGLVDDRYYILKYQDILTAYTPYGFNSTIANKPIYDQLLNNIVWRLFSETNEHKLLYKEVMSNNGRNCVVTGYAGIDELIDKNYKPSTKCWHDDKRKHIIWAPHHTIEPVGMISFSCFLKYCDFMIKMAKKYEDKIQIVFKPHPILFEKLKNVWGIEKTTSYYEKWKTMSNTNFNDGEYIDLFLTSDAMIHDSGSFLIEYLYVNKPVMRTMSGEDMSKVLSKIAMDALDVYYKAYSEADIENFIINVINGDDKLANERKTFVNKRLMPPNNHLSSQNIIDDILDSIDNQILYRK